MFHSYVEFPEVISFFWVCIPTILMLVFKVPKSVVCSTLNFWCIPIFACKLGSIPRWVSTRHYQLWDHWVECFYMLFQISGFHPLVSISHILWSTPVFALVGATMVLEKWTYLTFICGCFALRPPHVMSWKDASDWVCENYATMRLQSCVVLRTDVSSFHADWWLHGIWSCPPHRCWIMPLTFPWVLWLARALRGAGETSLSNPNRQTMANGHDWKYLWNNWKSSISKCESVPLWCFHCYS